ncbi:MAG: aspartyl/asparaginyl beta-hydroxylase domain-containing protein [Pseudolabrys sp.]|nr:aspartyl/asparaginyl beta-hydroxylase domain-containing protein [Pseudolabrys sp.]
MTTTADPGAKVQGAAQPAPTQQFGTAGIAEMGGASRVTRMVMSIVAFAERLNLRHTKVGNPPIYDNAVFPWAREIEAEWPAIRKELDKVLVRKEDLPGFHELSSDVATISKDRGWKTFLLCGYGFKSDANIEQCPETWRICQKIPGLTTVMFSIFEPNKHLPAHRGPYNGVLRLHLGLKVPEPREDLGIRVENEVYRWKEGEVVIFDDAYEHEAWNKTSDTRVVLFVDFIKPLRFPANILNWLLLHVAVFTPFIREGMDNQKAWEKKFYAEAAALRNR